MPNDATPIGLMSAMHAELAQLLDAMPDEQRVSVAGRDFWQGHWQGRPVVAVLSRIGKVAAATTATVLIERFGVDRIVFTGVAGGIGPGVRVGDVVLAETLVQHDMDASPLFPRWEMPGYGRSRFDADPVLVQVLHEAAKDAVTWLPKLLDAQTMAELGLHRPHVHQGEIITGDRFISTAADSDALRAAFPEAWAVDMETAAVAQVCHDHGVPFGAVRVVSDRADEEAHVDFQHFLNQVARHYSARIVRKALNLL